MNTAAELPAAPPEHGLMTFEQPLSERMRTFLRVEFLFGQTLFHVDEPTEFSSRAAVSALLEILTILGRGDVRSDVVKELERHGDILNRFKSQPGVDPSRLTGLIDNIGDLRQQLAEAGPHLINPLKECDFLNTIRHRSGIPGGTCMFDLPDYGYWLHLPPSPRCCGSRARRRWPPSKSLRAVCSNSASTAAGNRASCASSCRSTPACSRRSAPASIASRSDSYAGVASTHGPSRSTRTCGFSSRSAS